MRNLGFTTPFEENIMKAFTPRKVKVPPIDHYDGTTDPIDHLAAFKVQMSVQTSSEAAWCKFFPTTLKGLALTWFTELPYGSISSFNALETAFKQMFIAGRRHRKTSIHLMSIKQRREEDLADYIKRFNVESLKVSDLQDTVAFTALMSGLYPSSRFKLKLAESEASSFSEAMNLAQKFIQASDICKTHEEPSSRKRKHEYTPRADNPKDVSRKEKDKKPRLENHWNDPRYNLNQREIYLDIKGKYPLPKPHPIRTSVNKRDKKLWCEFHHDCGHTTRECQELKRDLYKLADEGKLNRYLTDPKENKVEPHSEKQARSDETVGYVNVIAGGFASGGLTSRSRKKHLYTLKHGSDTNSSAICPTMTFKNSHRPIQTPHDDLLVVEMKIANLRVGRVLIDSGNSANIITMYCLRKLKYEEKDLTPIDQPLVWFGG
ncbi:uncharacterized protein LOC104903211 [Beta vulgaris subsp. vulgaris]|uniref:uncharacterized protein LOC104903211 n=1 Tax=Beta vulgaris subsp. vulgaris TaxID=3555 RepID=UPI00203710B0|nr:uncharacterized protein LOC104903211 [Beta vulgaris subsp. vulgaris]